MEILAPLFLKFRINMLKETPMFEDIDLKIGDNTAQAGTVQENTIMTNDCSKFIQCTVPNTDACCTAVC